VENAGLKNVGPISGIENADPQMFDQNVEVENARLEKCGAIDLLDHRHDHQTHQHISRHELVHLRHLSVAC